jgi:FkbH-like protein
MTTLHWLPKPTDFKQQLKSANAIAAPDTRLERLCEIANQQLGFMETMQLDHALRSLRAQLAPNTPAVRIVVLSHATVDHLAPALRVAGLRRRFLLDVHLGTFGQVRQQLHEPGEELRRFAPEYLLLTQGCRELLAGIPVTADEQALDAGITRAVGDVRFLWKQAREKFGAQVIQQTVLDVTEPVFGNFDSMVPAAPSRVVARFNDALLAAAAQEGVLVLDIGRLSARDGLDAWFDTARWLQGKIEIAPLAAPRYCEVVARLIGVQRGLARKCLVLDLDNTLWGGVIGDAGVENIVLGEGSAAGEAHLALHRYAKALSQRGVLLAVCSKNDAAIAEGAFRDHPEMLLKRADFSAFMANWDDKAQNLRSIAAQLNIGLDSLVFVDDNPAERARIRESLPMVAVPELPEDPANYVRCLADAGYFEAVAFTAEDRERVAQYAANELRDNLLESSQSMDEFLRGLDMWVEYGRVTPLDLPRAAQLINKTNQFNLTGIRLTAEALTAIAADPRNIVLFFRLIDRFSDNGLVSVMLLSPSPDDPAALQIDNWVMSCRVFGRELEMEAMNIAVEHAVAAGARSLRGSIVPTKKNGVIAGLYEKLGFEKAAAPPGGESHIWTAELTGRQPIPTRIKRRNRT